MEKAMNIKNCNFMIRREIDSKNFVIDESQKGPTGCMHRFPSNCSNNNNSRGLPMHNNNKWPLSLASCFVHKSLQTGYCM